MKTVILLLVAACVVSGCSLVEPKVAPQIAKGVNRYCQEPYAERQLIRQSVNSQTGGNKITVTCEGDPQ